MGAKEKGKWISVEVTVWDYTCFIFLIGMGGAAGNQRMAVRYPRRVITCDFL